MIMRYINWFDWSSSLHSDLLIHVPKTKTHELNTHSRADRQTKQQTSCRRRVIDQLVSLHMDRCDALLFNFMFFFFFCSCISNNLLVSNHIYIKRIATLALRARVTWALTTTGSQRRSGATVLDARFTRDRSVGARGFNTFLLALVLNHTGQYM